MHVAAGTGDAVTRPELEAALAALKVQLMDRIAEGERRTAALAWRMFGGMVGVAGVAVALLRYLP